MTLRRWFLIRNQAFATTGQHDVSGISESGARPNPHSRTGCGYLESEIVTPDGAQPSVLLNDGLDPGVEYAAELVSAPASATFLSLDGMALLSTKGRFRRHSPTGSGSGAHTSALHRSRSRYRQRRRSSIVKVSVSGSWFDAEIKHSNGSAWSSVEIRHYSGGWTPL